MHSTRVLYDQRGSFSDAGLGHLARACLLLTVEDLRAGLLYSAPWDYENMHCEAQQIDVALHHTVN